MRLIFHELCEVKVLSRTYPEAINVSRGILSKCLEYFEYFKLNRQAIMSTLYTSPSAKYNLQ